MNNINWTSGETEEKVYLKRDSRISKQSNPPHNKHFPFIPPPPTHTTQSETIPGYIKEKPIPFMDTVNAVLRKTRTTSMLIT